MDRNFQIIFVDLDNTLVRTDMFVEGIFDLLRSNPSNIFLLLLWLAKGRAFAKSQVAARSRIRIGDLPYEAALVDYLKEQKSRGCQIVLTTAASRQHADAVAAYLGIFDDVIATDQFRNLKGHSKLAAIHEAFPGVTFAYAGDSPADRPIWQAALANILVNAPSSDIQAASHADKAELIIRSRPPLWCAFLKEMRLHQYAKNVLIFVPLFTSHAYDDIGTVVAVAIAFVCFSLCASGVYFLNDLLDLPADRQHATKRRRPLASGDLPIAAGVAGAIGLPAAALVAAALFLPALFVLVLATYYLLTNLYSFALKRISTADVMKLAVLYTLRVAAGGAATDIALSFWLIAFSIFVFVSLAYLKRYIEVTSSSVGSGLVAGRGYAAADAESMFALGIANSTASVLVLAFYINRSEVAELYRTPELLWSLCLLLLYWINRVWVGARRGKIADDPVVFAIRDRVSGLIALSFAAVVLTAKHVSLWP